MAPRQSIFATLPPSILDVTEAVEKIEILIAAKKLKSKLFYDMLFGFRVLEEAMQQKQNEAFNLVIKWLNLFLKIQTSLIIQNDDIRSQFEKVVPSAVTYIIGCLQYKAKGIDSYHYQILAMIHELLSNVRPGVLEDLATFETGVIACVWFPIGFVGDFNTQMMALRLLAMLLKCVDSTRLQRELDSIRCTEKSILKNKLTAAIAVANFHTAKFENTARDLLNTYNMHLAQKILVYSFRCKTFKFENNIEFFKPMNAESFWLDLNYCPRTLSFHGQCQTSRNSAYINCSVSLQVTKLSLCQLSLTVEFQAPLQFTTESNDFPNLNNLTAAKIILTRDEAMRLMENKYIFRYFNESQRSALSNRSISFVKLNDVSTPIQLPSVTDEPIANAASSSAFDQFSFGNINNYSNIEDVENKENVPPSNLNWNRPKTGNIDAHTVSKQFQKSYEFLIGANHESNDFSKIKSKVVNKNNNRTKETAGEWNSHQPTTSTNKQAPATTTTNTNIITENNKETPKSTKTTTNTRRKIVNYSTSTSESQPSSQKCKQPQKRFFKTQHSNSDTEYAPCKTKRSYRKQKPRTTKQTTPKATKKKSKIINEVKPMLNSSKEFGKLTSAISNNNALNATTNESKLNGTIIDLTDTCLSDLTTNIYENLVVSDAEPGQSYRNFTLRRNLIDSESNVGEIKRSRKALPRAVKKENQPNGKPQTSRAQVKSATKRPGGIFDAIKGEQMSHSKSKKTETTTLPNKNQFVYPADVNMCVSSHQKLPDLMLRRSTSYNQRNIPTQTLTENRNAVMELPKTEPNMDEVPTTSLQSFENNFTNNKKTENKTTNNSPKATVAANLNENLFDDLQVCRRDVNQNNFSNINDCDEFSDYPTFSPLIDVSNMLLSSDYESTPDVTVDVARLTTTNNNVTSPTKEISPDLTLQIYDAKKSNPQKSVIYCSRSENDSDSDSDHSQISKNAPEVRPLQPLELSKHVFLTPQLPLQNFRQTTSVTKRQVTTMETSITTHQDRVIHQQKCIINLATSSDTPLNLSKSCSRATTSTTTTTKTVVEEKQEVNMNNSKQSHMDITAPTPEALRQESSNMIANYKSNLNLSLNQMESSIYKNPVTAYIEKICDISESMINEIEGERKSLLELEANTERLTRQLGWQYEAFRQKTQQFKCFKHNIDALLSVINNIKLSEEIETETRHKIQQLQQASHSLSTQQWRNFVNETTENLLKDISVLSNL